MEGSHQILPDIPTVKITPQGIFKYILIQATIDRNGTTTETAFVRGHKDLEYHQDNFV